MNIMKRRQKTIEDLKNKEYRDAFSVEHIDTGIPFQIRVLREQKGREWTQKELGARAGMAQETISRIEDPNYGKLTLKTLKKLASAFDVALMVRFVPFSELVGWELSMTSTSMEAASFDEDFKSDVTNERIAVSEEVVVLEEPEFTIGREETVSTAETSSTNKIAYIKDYMARRDMPSFVPQNAVGIG